MRTNKQRVIDLIKDQGIFNLDKPTRLSSGLMSRQIVDIKRALANGASLRLAAKALLEIWGQTNFEVVGGPSTGAQPLAISLSCLQGYEWFFVRPKAKRYGRGQQIEGANVANRPILVIDDVATSGQSLQQASQVVSQAGGQIIGLTAIVDRGRMAEQLLEKLNYQPLLTYRDLNLEPLEPFNPGKS